MIELQAGEMRKEESDAMITQVDSVQRAVIGQQFPKLHC